MVLSGWSLNTQTFQFKDLVKLNVIWVCCRRDVLLQMNAYLYRSVKLSAEVVGVWLNSVNKQTLITFRVLWLYAVTVATAAFFLFCFCLPLVYFYHCCVLLEDRDMGQNFQWDERSSLWSTSSLISHKQHQEQEQQLHATDSEFPPSRMQKPNRSVHNACRSLFNARKMWLMNTKYCIMHAN